MKTLIVDDHAHNRTLPKVILGKLGHATVEAASGPAALALIEQDPDIDRVLLDINMPVMTGTEVCQKLRQTVRGQALLIVAYTAHAYPHESEQIMAAGFDDLLIKPITREGLLAALKLG